MESETQPFSDGGDKPTAPLLPKGKEKLRGMVDSPEGSRAVDSSQGTVPYQSSTDDVISKAGYSQPTVKSETQATRLFGCKCLTCSTLCALLVLIVIGAPIAGFGVLWFIPYPSVTTTQVLLPGDTVPLYYSSKDQIPSGASTFWYESISVSVSEDFETFPQVSLVFVKGDSACVPLSDRNTTNSSQVNDVLVTPESVPVQSEKYFTKSAAMSLNVTVNSAGGGDIDIDVVVLSIREDCVDDRDCFIENTRFPVNSDPGSTTEVKYTFPLSTYYEVLLITSDNNITVDYSYQTTSFAYNITDYNDAKFDTYGTCTIQSVEDNLCVFELERRKGCVFAYSPTPEDEDETVFIDLDVRVTHSKFTIPSVICLALAIGAIILTVSFVVGFMGRSCRNRYCGDYAKL